MRRAVLTTAAGILLTLAALVFDAAPLFVVGLGFLLLGVLTPAWVWLAARGASVERTLVATRVTEGQPVEAIIQLRRGRLGLPGAEIHDPLARDPVCVSVPMGLIAGEAIATVRLVTHFERRGRRRLAPPELRVSDPLSLATVRRPGSGSEQELLVLPRTEPVNWSAAQRGPRRGRVHEGHSEEPPAAVDIDGLRPYRPGSPASRIHWPAYARGAGLLERRLQADGETLPLVVLDPRDLGDTEALDAAVRATASLTLALARAGGCRLLLDGERRPVTVNGDLRNWPGLHTRLALTEGGAGAPAPVLGEAVAYGSVYYVAAQPMRRLPVAVRSGRRGLRALVLPCGLGDGIEEAASFEVSGCHGYVLRSAAAHRPTARV